MGAREARREAARRNGGKPRERCKAGSRDGSEPRKGSVTGVGRKIRTEVVRGVSRRLPWSRRGRMRVGVVRHDPRRCPAGRRRRSPEEHGRLRPNGYSGLRRVRAAGVPSRCRSRTPVAGDQPAESRRGRRSAQRGPEAAGRSPVAIWRLSSAWTRERSSGWVTPTQRPWPSRHGEGGGGQRLGHHLGQQDLGLLRGVGGGVHGGLEDGVEGRSEAPEVHGDPGVGRQGRGLTTVAGRRSRPRAWPAPGAARRPGRACRRRPPCRCPG